MKVFHSYINIFNFKCFISYVYNQGTASLLLPEDMTNGRFIGSMANSHK